MASITINPQEWPVCDVLPILLFDRTKRENIIFATDSYEAKGTQYGPKCQITEDLLTQDDVCFIQPRVLKAREEQALRTRKKAEVFTPAWVCCFMNDYCDEVWFERNNVFFSLEGETWMPSIWPLIPPKPKTWQDYVDARRLEITCGEAPFLVSRYDMGTGEIIPIRMRIGLLDRKLRIVNEKVSSESEWLKWTLRAFQSVYGYEFQGDSLLVARINLLLTYVDYLQDRWQRKPTDRELREIAKVISWNLWQMDGLTCTIPFGVLQAESQQTSFFDVSSTENDPEKPMEYPPSRVFDWRGWKKSIAFNSIIEGRNSSMKFDYIIGNPPYQEETESDSTRKPPIYNAFMEEAFQRADIVELITPARFLFNAGYTPKAWNEKMLSDEHFKVIFYEPDSSKVFSNTDIKGGVVVTYRNAHAEFGAIDTFTKYPELNDILKKVRKSCSSFLDSIISSPLSFKVSQKMLDDFPDSVGRLRTSAFTKLSEIFHESIPNDNYSYIGMIGLLNSKRVTRYVRKDYIVDGSGTLDKFTLLVAKANGAGEFGEVLSDFCVANPGIAYTQTFIGIGKCETETEVQNISRYIRSKFARAMLGVLKITQDCPGPKWKFVPLQNFTPDSDINWNTSIANIDKQLYMKYGLSPEEIAFIESHVKEME